MKKQILGLTCLALGLTACGGNISATTSQPQSTVITVIETPSAAPATSAAPAPEQTQAPTQQVEPAAQQTQAPVQQAPAPTETPVQAIQMPEPPAQNANLQSFAGSTQKGNDVYFVIFPAEDQVSINSIAKGQNLNGSWGSLCSNMATHDQLKETAIQTYTPGGSMTIWSSYDYAFVFSGKSDNQLESVKAKILDVSNQYAAGHAACKPFYSGYPSSYSQTFSAAEVGQYNIDTPTTGIAPLSKL